MTARTGVAQPVFGAVLLAAALAIPSVVRGQGLAGSGCAGAAAKACAGYEVVIEFNGYTGLIGGAPDCAVNPQGYDRLTGTVYGRETAEKDVDVIYTGVLKRETAIDFCETRGKSGPGDDERVYCVVRLTGSAATNVELTVYGEEGRGAHMKTTTVKGAAPPVVRGDCDPRETDQIRADYPYASEGGAATPNGQPIDEERATDPSGRAIAFFAGGLSRLRVGTYPPAQEDGWTLRVIRRVP